MTHPKLETVTVDQLVERFVEIGIAQDDALLGNEITRFNYLFDQMQEVVQELQRRSGDQRRALVALYDHPSMQVRVKAAKNTLAVAPQAARDTLENIKASKWQPQALEAGMSLWNLERGVFKPT